MDYLYCYNYEGISKELSQVSCIQFLKNTEVVLCCFWLTMKM